MGIEDLNIKLKIPQIGDPVLRQTAKPLTIEEIQTPHIQQLIELMKKTMRDAPGVGLAAPQIGESIQLVVIEDRPEYMQNFSPEELAKRGRRPVPFQVIINPVLTLLETEKPVTFFEGCLSIAGFMGLVSRAPVVTVKCLNERAQSLTIHAQGWYARILQHEIDHLYGHLCIDRTQLRSLTTVDNYLRYGPYSQSSPSSKNESAENE